MKNTLKKVVSVVSLIAFVLSLTVFAVVAESTDINATVALITDADPTLDKLNITVTPENTDKWVTVVITDENGSPLDVLQQAAAATNNIQFSLVGVTSAQTIKIRVSVAPSNKTKVFTQKYYTYAQQQEAIADIMDENEPITQEIADIISLNLEGDFALLNEDGIDFLKEQLRTEYEGQTDIDVGDFITTLSNKIEVSILSSKDVEIIEYYMEREKVSLGISTLTEYEWYIDEYSDDVKDAILAKIAENTYTSAEAFVNAFKGQCFLEKLSTQYSTNIIEFLSTHADNQYDGDTPLVIDLAAYNNLEDFQKTYFVDQITGIRHDTIADFKSDFDAKLIAAASYEEEQTEFPPVEEDSGSTGGSLGTVTGGSIGGGTVGGNVVPPSTSDGSASVSFKDIDSVPWANEAISSLANDGVIHGIDGENFDPLGIVTKEQFVQIIVGAFNIKHNGNLVSFNDVPASQWYSKSIEIAAVNGIVFGVNDTDFGLGTQITRQDMATIIYRVAKKQNITLTKVTTDVPTDIDSVPEYAREAVTALYQAGIIYGVGDGRFAPADIATRAQAAKIIYELRRLV